MNSTQRRDEILNIIRQSTKPCSATSLANKVKVSRQIVVGDVALLRASGKHIIATPRGYILENKEFDGIVRTIAVTHQEDEVKEELYTIVDQGGTIIDVIVEHPLYGQLSGQLHISSRFDVDQFVTHLQREHVKPLSDLTNGLHLHTIGCIDEMMYERILQTLKQKGFLYEKS